MGRAIEPRKSSNEKADAFPLAEGNTDSPVNLDEGRSASPESKSSARMHTPTAREPGDLGRASPSDVVGGRQPRKGNCRNPRTKASEESDAVVVPEKSSNAQVTLAETMEERAAAKGMLADETRTGRRAGDCAPTNISWLGQRAQSTRYAAYPRWEPGAGNPLAGICPGGGPKGPSLPGSALSPS